jgi:hypothetical protein
VFSTAPKRWNWLAFQEHREHVLASSSVAGSCCVDAVATAAFGESCRRSGHALTARFDPVGLAARRHDAAQQDAIEFRTPFPLDEAGAVMAVASKTFQQTSLDIALTIP